MLDLVAAEMLEALKRAGEELEAAVSDDTAAVFLQNPNFLGAVEDITALGEAVKAKGAMLIVQVDPMTLGILRPPGECGADIAYGEGQPLGNRLDFGGPSFGFFCAKEEYLRKMPGRIAGQTEDVDGRRGFVLALQTREQHIRREKATSNICTAQALNSLAGMVHLSWLGKQGFVEIGELMARRTAYARQVIGSLDGYELLHEAPVVREFAVSSERAVEEILPLGDESEGPASKLPVYPLGRDYPEYEDCFLVAITENRSLDEIGWLAHMLEHAQAGWGEHIHDHDESGEPVAHDHGEAVSGGAR